MLFRIWARSLGAIPATADGIDHFGENDDSRRGSQYDMPNFEGNVISPQVVGRTLHMHPLSIIFALLVGGEISGIIGMILAVPIFAALKVIVQHMFAYYVRRKII